MSYSLISLLTTYPHIRGSIFNNLSPYEIDRLCYAVHFRLDVYDKKTFLNPMYEAFDVNEYDSPVLTTVLIGEHIKSVRTIHPSSMIFYSYNHVENDIVLKPTELERVRMSITKYSEVNYTSSALDEIIRINREMYRRIVGTYRSTIRGVEYDYYIDCVVSRNREWRFDRVRIRVETTSSNGGVYYPDSNFAMSITITIPLINSNVVLEEVLNQRYAL